jgi:Tfp pilus assembly protein PilO
MFSSIESKIILALGIVIALLGIAGYFYWDWSQNQIKVLEQNNAKLEDAVKIQKETIAGLQEAAVKQNAAILDLQLRQNASNSSYTNTVRNIMKTNIPVQASQNIQATEQQMQQDTQAIFGGIESATQPDQDKAKK